MKFVFLEANVSKFLVGHPNTCWIAILIQPGSIFNPLRVVVFPIRLIITRRERSGLPRQFWLI